MEQPSNTPDLGLPSTSQYTDARTTLLDLPDGVLRAVFSHLHRRDFPAVRCTCSHWREVLDSCLDSLKPKRLDRVVAPKLMTRFSNLQTLAVLHTACERKAQPTSHLSCLSTQHCLQTVVMAYTKVEDLHILMRCQNLRSLCLSLCGSVEDIQCLASCSNLTHLDLSHTDVRDAGPLAACKQLKLLSLCGCGQLTSLGALTSSSTLQALDLSFQNLGLQDLGDISTWTALQMLALGCTPTHNLESLAACKNLQTLDLASCNGLTEGDLLSGLASCSTLEVLLLQGFDKLQGVVFVPRLLPKLVGLDLCETQVRDISPLSLCTLLQKLRLCCTNVHDVSPLSGCQCLEWLDMSCCFHVSDIAPLAACTRLTALYLDDSPVADISPLAACTNLRYLVYPDPDDEDNEPVGSSAVRKACPFLEVLYHCDYECEVVPREPFHKLRTAVIDSFLE